MPTASASFLLLPQCQGLALDHPGPAQHRPFSHQLRARLDAVDTGTDLALVGPADRQHVSLAQADADIRIQDPLAPFHQVTISQAFDLDVGGLLLAIELETLSLVMPCNLDLLPRGNDPLV